MPIQGILPHFAQGFELTKGANILGTNLDKALRMLEVENYDLIMVCAPFMLSRSMLLSNSFT